MDRAKAQDNIECFSITIPNHLESIIEVIQSLSDFAEQHQIANKITATLSMAIDELISNSIKYGYPNHSADVIQVSGILRENNIQLTIQDQAAPFNPLLRKKPDMPVSIEDQEIGGQGIHLLLAMVDQVEYNYREGQNIMVLTMFLQDKNKIDR